MEHLKEAEGTSEFALTSKLIKRAIALGFQFMGHMQRSVYRHTLDSLILTNHERIEKLESRIEAIEARDEDHEFRMIDPPE